MHTRLAVLLRNNKNFILCYAAMEIRFAVERMVENQLALSSKVSANTLKKNDPVKTESNFDTKSRNRRGISLGT